MKITAAHRKAINDKARSTTIGRFKRCEIAIHISDDGVQATNQLLLAEQRRASRTDLQDFVPLGSLRTVEEHFLGASLDVWVYAYDGLSHNLYAAIRPSGQIRVTDRTEDVEAFLT